MCGKKNNALLTKDDLRTGQSSRYFTEDSYLILRITSAYKE